MEKAKSAVSDFLGKSGKHDTHVHEEVAPAVTRETQNTHAHENVTTALDREVHQHHYHTSVQPITHKEKLPEKHHANVAPVQHREHDHRDHEGIKQKLEVEKAKFQNETIRGGTTQETRSDAPVVSGEHVHHHVHENIQPVIHKETIQPHVVHTTVPIHETHHQDAKHHATSALPAISLDEFKSHGGNLGGREARHDFFEGEPRANAASGAVGSNRASTNTTSGSTTNRGLDSVGARDGHHHHNTAATGAAGTTATGLSSHNNHNHTHNTTHTNAPTSGINPSNTSTSTHGPGHSSRDSGAYDTTDLVNQKHSSTTSSATQQKPSLLNKVNPATDSNGDGKKGFMK